MPTNALFDALAHLSITSPGTVEDSQQLSKFVIAEHNESSFIKIKPRHCRNRVNVMLIGFLYAQQQCEQHGKKNNPRHSNAFKRHSQIGWPATNATKSEKGYIAKRFSSPAKAFMGK
jgi:hypothetical protein